MNLLQVAAILGSCPRTIESFRSGIRNWCKFADLALGGASHAFPPTVDAILLWSHTFRCVGTFSNYVGHLRTACLLADVAMPPADHPALQRAKTSVVKRMLHTPRQRLFIQRAMMRNMILSVEQNIETQSFAMLWLAAYIFLLRLPSEALPMVRGDGGPMVGEQSTLYLDSGGRLCLALRRRKNRQGGSLLRRTCACAACPSVCPVHALWGQFFSLLPIGTKPWSQVSADRARRQLRSTLERLQVAHLCVLLAWLGFAVGTGAELCFLWHA